MKEGAKLRKPSSNVSKKPLLMNINEISQYREWGRHPCRALSGAEQSVRQSFVAHRRLIGFRMELRPMEVQLQEMYRVLSLGVKRGAHQGSLCAQSYQVFRNAQVS